MFVIGDMAAVDGVPGMAQGAIQGAKYVATAIKSEIRGANPLEREPFEYFDKGSMATVSRFSAVAQIGPLEFGGFIAWLAWLVLHLVYLVGFRRKIATLLSWTVTFLGRARGNLYITEQQAYARTRIEELEEIAARGRASREGGERAAQLLAQPVALPGGQATACGQREHRAHRVGGDVRVTQFAHQASGAPSSSCASDPEPSSMRCRSNGAPSTSACSDPVQNPCRSLVLPICTRSRSLTRPAR